MTSYTVSDVTGSTLTPNILTMDNSSASDMGNMTSDNTSLTTTVAQFSGRKYGPLEDFPQFWVAFYINKYYLNIIAAIGFPGNILSFITILKIKPHSHPSIYVAVLAVSDNFCLVTKILFTELTRHDINVGPYGCKFLYFIGNTMAIYANWLLVMMTVERFMAIWFPLKVGAFCTRRRTAVAMGFLLLLASGLCSTLFEITHDLLVGTDFKCVFKEEYSQFVNYVWYWLDGTFFALLPCLLLVIFNTLIIVGIRRAASIQRQLTEDSRSRNKYMSGQAAEKVRQQRQITIMLVIVCVVFVFLMMPVCIFFIYKPYWTYTPYTVEDANFKVTEQVAFFLADCSHAINFFVYFISTKKFRDRFIDTLCCCRKWKRHIARSSHVGQSQFSETGSIYVTSTSNGGVIPLSLRNSGRY